MAKSGPKSSPSSIYLDAVLFKIVQKVENIWATFVRKSCRQNLSKVAQSGLTVHDMTQNYQGFALSALCERRQRRKRSFVLIQCDQMARMFIHFFVIYNNENLPNCM